MSRRVTKLIKASSKATPKRAYDKPRVVHTEKIEARAVSCAKASEGACAGGPIQS